MNNIANIITGLVTEKLNFIELRVFEYFVKEILNASSQGEDSLVFAIFSKPVNSNIANFCLKVLEKSNLFVLINYSDRFKVLDSKQQGNFLVKYPFVVVVYADNGIEFSLNRYFFYRVVCETQIQAIIAKKNISFDYNVIVNNLDKITDQKLNQEQKQAIINSIKHSFSIITGGPGVGKTTSIKAFVQLLITMHPQYQISICTPTGKATNRIKELLTIANNDNNLKFSTIHALLGIYPGYKNINVINSEIIIIDESSMIGLFLLYKLLSAVNLNKIKHIIFIGDVNQLPPVEVGKVFKGMVDSYPDYVSKLRVNLRSNNSIINLAQYLLARDSVNFFNSIELAGDCQIKGIAIKDILQRFFAVKEPSYYNYLQYLKNINQAGSDSISQDEIMKLFSLYQEFRVLCLLNIGSYGVIAVNNVIEEILLYYLTEKTEQSKTFDLSLTDSSGQKLYIGKPIMITKNNQNLKLYNGDIGILVKVEGSYQAAFMNDANGYHSIPLVLINNYELAYALTVHKTQGSEFNKIMLIIPNRHGSEKNNIYSNQMLYTAITRAKTHLSIFADHSSLKYMIDH